MNPPRLYFFGVWDAGGAGHYLRTPEGRDVPHGRAGLPWAVHELDGGLTWNAGEWIVSGSSRWRGPARGVSEQGDAALRYRDGWTVLAWHDFTGDRRGGSNSAVFAEGTFTFEQMLVLFAHRFPHQHQRQPGMDLIHCDPLPKTTPPDAAA